MTQAQWHIHQGSIDDMLVVEQQIPEFSNPKTREQILQRLAGRTYLALIVSCNSQPVAYKLGYEQAPQQFYSWLGAVIPDFRGKGMARALLLEQEHWCREQGFSHIEVKTMNRFKTMMQMLVSHDYHIAELTHPATPTDTLLDVQIRFRKAL
ncbi:GNAT family N-acetyltransferase [Pseudoalteromonas sp. OOF1S-7]|uniref:GNAT family N-acetyltransferase n=1 Tax=Pseudoalteromonas sp. OOF1S-7 TaxID=2917757 RepID=UPI001EF473EB|nr:GNAT family N-acetyltransferase [Pseudoalteromonas sp. OOF1S-7]MCG7536907.1 GNAT family N-acetyltransferase [Pseudoalteromonas sp. OOF1S-7]